MWHPSFETNVSPSDQVGNDLDLQAEEQNQLKQALKESMEASIPRCQFCKGTCKDKDALQLHQVNCLVINGSDLPILERESQNVFVSTEFVGLGNPVVSSPLPGENSVKTVTPLLPSRRKSSRSQKKTARMAEYERELKGEKTLDEVEDEEKVNDPPLPR